MFIPDEPYIKRLSHQYNRVYNWINKSPFTGYCDLLEFSAEPTEFGFLIQCIPYECLLYDPTVWGTLRSGKIAKNLRKFVIKGFVPIREVWGKGTVHEHFHVVCYLPSNPNKLICADQPFPFIQALKDRIEWYNNQRISGQYDKNLQKQQHILNSKISRDYAKIMEESKKFERAADDSFREEKTLPSDTETTSKTGIRYEGRKRHRRG